jgi:arylsulfatase A-like enzyme
VQIFAYLRSPLTYALLYLADNPANMRSSIGAFVTAGVAAGLVGVPLLWALLTHRSLQASRPGPRSRWLAAGLGLLAVAWFAAGRSAYEGRWHDRDDHLIAKSPHRALLVSVASELLGRGEAARFEQDYPQELLQDFRPPKARELFQPHFAAPRRPRNVILVVLESTGAKYASLYGSRYDTTPTLVAESRNALVFDDFYCHVGMTANSVAALTLSIYPYMTWREYTVEYPEMPGDSLGDVLKRHGMRTAFIHSGDLAYTNQRAFLGHRGFDALIDYIDMKAPVVSSWGSHDGALVDGVLKWIDEGGDAPFFVKAWTTQSHHPYEPAPDVPLIDFFAGGPLPEDDYDLGRYLNTVHYTDAQLARLFAGLRERGLADDTLVVVTGDHGEAFGEPHNAWGHGSRVYDESPTITDVLGLPPSPLWLGRSLFDPKRPGRAYFYAANDDYLLGVREGKWKYIYNATRGRDELFDVETDPREQRNAAKQHPDLCHRLRQRLAAWRDDTGRHLAEIRAAAAGAPSNVP